MDNSTNSQISRRGFFTFVAGAGVGASALPPVRARDIPVDRHVEGTVSKRYRKHVVVTTDNGERVPVQLPSSLHVQEGDRLRATIKNTRVGYITRNIATTAALII